MTDLHPDDDSLNAAVDGEDRHAADHVASCPACREQADALRAVSRMVAAQPAPGAPSGLADRAVAAASAAFGAERAGSAGGVGEADDDSAVPLRALAGPPSSITSHRPAHARERRVPAWAMGIAAALLAVLVAVPLLDRETGEPDRTAAAQLDRSEATAGDAAAPPVVDGGDLGNQSDQLALGTLLAGAVTGAPSAPAAASAPARSSDQSGADAESTGPPVAAPGTTDLTGATPTEAFAESRAPRPDAAAVAACEQAVATEYARGLGPLLYRATLQWQATPAVLLAYRLADTSASGPDHRAFVMALDGCRLLVVQGF
jgi:hypothetical protein